MYKELRDTQSCVGMQGATWALLLNDADGHASGHAVVATHTYFSNIWIFYIKHKWLVPWEDPMSELGSIKGRKIGEGRD